MGIGKVTVFTPVTPLEKVWNIYSTVYSLPFCSLRHLVSVEIQSTLSLYLNKTENLKKNIHIGLFIFPSFYNLFSSEFI